MPEFNWDTFVEARYQSVYRYCYQFLGAKEDAEDACQKTFLRAWRSAHRLREIAALKSWIFSIARNVCIDQSRWWKRRKTESLSRHNPDSSTGDIDLSMTLRKLISALPIKQREVFILRHFHEFSTTETAELMRIQEGTVKSHLKRAIDSLRRELESLGYQPIEQTFSPSLTTEAGGDSSEYLEEERVP